MGLMGVDKAHVAFKLLNLWGGGGGGKANVALEFKAIQGV